MHNFTSLKILDFFQPLFRTMKIDYPTMRKILEVKLTMDQRRVPTILNDMSKKKKEGKNNFLLSLLIYAFYGLMLVPFIFLGDSYMFQISIMIGISMFILMTSLISDFSSVLLNIRDKAILNTKPIHPRTLSAAKIVHIAIYLSLITGAFIAIPSVVMIFTKGIVYFLIFLVEIILLGLFIMAFTVLVYMFILRLFDGEKLKDIINYVQILLAIGVVVGYQIVIRLFDFVDQEFIYDFSWWHVLIPPIWFGAPFELLLNQEYSIGIILLSILAVIGPIVSIYIYSLLMPSFERNLQKLMEESGTRKKRSWNLSESIGRFICISKEERAFYRFSSIMMSRERDFKLKVYPSLGMALVFPFIFLFNNLGYQSFSDISQGKSYLTIYFCNIIIGTVVYMLQFSGKYKGAWIFQTTPIHKHSAVYRATLKAFLVKLYLPILSVLSIVYIWIFSFRIIPDLIIVFLSAILLVLIAYRVFNNGKYPFTEPLESANQSGGNTGKMILLMVAVAFFVLVHFIVLAIPFGIYGYLLVLCIINIVGWKLVFK